MTSILEGEPYIDRCSAVFRAKMSAFAEQGVSVDLGLWMQCYAFDVIGELYFGSQFGFLETGKDVQNYMEILGRRIPAFINIANLPPVWRMPYVLSQMLRKSFREDMKRIRGLEDVGPARIEEKRKLMEAEAGELDEAGREQIGRTDMLAKLFELHRTRGEKEDFGAADIEQEGNAGVFAGSDTTAIALRAVVYQLLRHPAAMARLQSELDDALAGGRLTVPVKYGDAIKLPFFCACVKEAMRLHPSAYISHATFQPAAANSEAKFSRRHGYGRQSRMRAL